MTATFDAPPSTPRAGDAPSLARRALAALAAAALFAVPFVVLTVLVLSESEELQEIDQHVADLLHDAVVGSRGLVGMLLTVGSISAPFVLRFVAAGIAVLLWRSGDRLGAIWLAVTLAIAGVLGGTLKLLVERSRPEFPEPVTTASGYSFPSGHALNSMAFALCVLVLLHPRTHGPLRALTWALLGLFVALVGLDRVALGVHFVSDVLAGWVVALAVVAATGLAFGMLRRPAPRLTSPLTASPDEEDHVAAPGTDPTPAPAPGELAPTDPRATWPRTLGHLLARLVPGWAAILAVLVLIGWLVTGPLADVWPMTAEDGINSGLEASRTDLGERITYLLGWLGATAPIVAVAVLAASVLRARLHRWAEAVFVLAAPLGQSVVFFFAQLVIERDRPDVERLDDSPPTSSFPSGHSSAAMALWWALALTCARVMRPGWRRTAVVVALALIPLGVVYARLYRGMHHPTDVAASLVNAGLVLLLTDRVVRGTTFPEAKEVRGP